MAQESQQPLSGLLRESTVVDNDVLVLLRHPDLMREIV